jgi:hypothetical protein
VSSLPVLGRQLDRCDVCGRKIHKMDLVRTNVDFLANEAQNYMTYSTYDSSIWDTWYGTDAGNISIGPYPDRSRISIADDNTTSLINGTPTITVASGVGPYVGYARIRSTNWGGQDLSSWNSLTFSFDYGFHQEDTTPDAYVRVWMYDSANQAQKFIETERQTGQHRVWGTIDMVDVNSDLDLTDVLFHVAFVTYGGGERIWVDRFQLEKDVSTPGTFVTTSGSAVDRAETPMTTVRKVCPNCRERVLRKSERYGKIAEQRTEEPVAVDIQEV